MEIHAPEKPILTIKEAAVHLLIVTAGILIALSLEGVVEYAHHRTVVREAREILRSEIEVNQKDLGQTIDQFKKQRDGLVKGIAIFSAMAKGERPKLEGMNAALAYRTARLHNAGRSTAELMGAFAYMNYREVSRYADIYDSQERFMREQAAALADGVAALAFTEGREHELATVAPADAAVFADRLRQTLAHITLAGQFGGALQRDYEKFLAGQ